MNNDRKPRRPVVRGARPLPSPHGKKAFELQFHWIFILIAGALILAFFFSVAYKQQAISEKKLQYRLVTDIENILTGAIVGKGTAQRLPVPPDGIRFECTEGCACQFFIDTTPGSFGERAIFAPEQLKDRDLFVWSFEWKLPYRATNFLFLTNPNIKYYFVYNSAESFSNGLLGQLTRKIPPPITQRGQVLTKFDYDNITAAEMKTMQKEEYEHAKFVLLNVDPATLDDSFRKSSFSAIKIDENGVGFYEKDGTSFRRVKYLSYVGLPSLYAAIFAQDHTMYECGLKTAFRKLAQVSQLYAERAAELQEKAFAAEKVWCAFGAPSATPVCQQPTDPATVVGMLCQQHRLGKELSTKIDDPKIRALSPLMEYLDSANRNFLQQGCPELF